ncbi:MAG TPA: UDP-N-acetylglucosamine 2-epimerase (non-hydrolyzing) [Candidatus Paceibacterota bacterium]|nr:UDP-N-acetylglucosamine 2-epimerase (non-hydrolyzing) [Candidatus Paceibacterota bacterium]
MIRRIAIFFGTRPEAIKMAPVIKAFQAAPGFRVLSVSTGQHREMLQQVVDLFGIRVYHDMDVMIARQTLATLSSRLIEKADAFLEAEKPDMALVQGDTTTVLMVALACFYRQIPVGHVEAGLRTGNILSPFPEEANRKLVTPLAALHFAPTEWSKANLMAESVPEASIEVTGNTVIDALRYEEEQQKQPGMAAQLEMQLDLLLGNDWRRRQMILITGHRRENFGWGFEAICRSIARLARSFSEVLFVYPVHLNPSVSGPVHERLAGLPNVRLILPQSYRPFVALMRASTLVLTDSGGVQEEAPSLGKPVLVMRDTTERPEGVESGTVRLVGADEEGIFRGVHELLTNQETYSKMSTAKNPYGDGNASARIVSAVRRFFVG